MPEEVPLDRVRVLATPNEPVRSRSDVLECSVVSYGGAWTSTLLDAVCPDSSRVGNPIFDIEPGDDFEDDLTCLLYAPFSRDGQCPGEPFDAALAALSPRDSPVDLAPLMGLGDSTNVAYRERDDVLVVVFQSGNYGDDCSHRTYENPPEGVAATPASAQSAVTRTWRRSRGPRTHFAPRSTGGKDHSWSCRTSTSQTGRAASC